MNFMPKTSKDMRHEATRQEYITRAVFSLTGYGLLFTTIIMIVVNIMIGQPMWWPVILMLEMGVLILLGSLLVHAKRWRVARYLIPLIFILLGSYITAQPSLGVAGVLAYALAVMLTAILFNTRAQWFTVLFSVLTYLYASWVSREYILTTYVSIGLIVAICLSGVAILQWLSSVLLTRALEDLSEEMAIRDESERKVHQKENILAATAKSAQLLLDSPDWRSKINELLTLLGKSTNASHAYLFENHPDQNGDPVISQKYEWVADGQLPDIDNPDYQNVPLVDEKMTDWYVTLSRGRPFYNTTKSLEARWADSLSRHNIKTLLDVPIFVDGHWWGVLGFDDCIHEMPWSQAEVDAVKISAGLLGSAIKNQAANAELRASEDKFQTAFHETFVPMVIGRISDRVILDSNEAFLNLTGYTREESLNKTASQLRLWSSEDEYRQYQQMM